MVIGSMGLHLILRLQVIILFLGVAGLNLCSLVECTHVGAFGELIQAQEQLSGSPNSPFHVYFICLT